MEYSQYSAERMSLFSLINGDIFYKSSYWPTYILRHFFRKPQSDHDTFIVFLFMLGRFSYFYVHANISIIILISLYFSTFLGNGCPSYYITKWLLSSQRNNRKRIKRLNQIKWLFECYTKKMRHWFYYDIEEHTYLYLSGEKRTIHNT